MKYWQCHYPSIHVIYRVKVFKNHRSHHKEICFLVKKISWLLKVIDLARIKDNIVPLQNCTFFIRKISWNGYEKLWKYSIESFIPCPISKNLRRKCVLPKFQFANNIVITCNDKNCHKCWKNFQSSMQLISIDDFIFMVTTKPLWINFQLYVKHPDS